MIYHSMHSFILTWKIVAKSLVSYLSSCSKEKLAIKKVPKKQMKDRQTKWTCWLSADLPLGATDPGCFQISIRVTRETFSSVEKLSVFPSRLTRKEMQQANQRKSKMSLISWLASYLFQSWLKEFKADKPSWEDRSNKQHGSTPLQSLDRVKLKKEEKTCSEMTMMTIKQPLDLVLVNLLN